MARIFANIAAFCSIFGLYFSVIPVAAEKTLIQQLILVFSIIAAVYVFIADVSHLIRERNKRYDSQRNIIDYMKSWIGQPGRTVIVSRDMSWAADVSVKQILINKAKSNELTIFLEGEIPLSQELRRAGAVIKEYGRLGFVPSTRLTICDFERNGSRIAVATKKSGTHIISELDSDDEPAFSLAHDLVKVLRSVE